MLSCAEFVFVLVFAPEELSQEAIGREETTRSYLSDPKVFRGIPLLVYYSAEARCKDGLRTEWPRHTN